KFKTNTLPAYPLLILFTFQRTHNPQHKSRKLQPNTVTNQTQEVFLTTAPVKTLLYKLNRSVNKILNLFLSFFKKSRFSKKINILLDMHPPNKNEESNLS
ncbi:unnamed protein product, partial [Commensalibacter communis]|uniref:hypothetical protein n=1 Tax=Commensalibacter communis TaxID=2972786 RepID=UPI0022FF9EF8